MFDIIALIIGLTFIFQGKDGKYTLRAFPSENTLGNMKRKLSIYFVLKHDTVPEQYLLISYNL